MQTTMRRWNWQLAFAMLAIGLAAAVGCRTSEVGLEDELFDESYSYSEEEPLNDEFGYDEAFEETWDYDHAGYSDEPVFDEWYVPFAASPDFGWEEDSYLTNDWYDENGEFGEWYSGVS